MRLHGITGIESTPRQIYHKRRKEYVPQKRTSPTKEEFRCVLMERMKAKNEK
ncbi:hypothetical protein [Pectinatus frisingensis]|uniref:hypothetical protein n=1 Tax=Pectinatus frisingensis TaxID=865 RepID=UPI0018C7F90A|nr:hypothetical protein [Pectinatus frisingensis]